MEMTTDVIQAALVKKIQTTPGSPGIIERLCKMGRLVENVCGHLDCRRGVMDDVLTVTDVGNWGRPNFGHITLPPLIEQTHAMQRLAHIGYDAIAALRPLNCRLTHSDLDMIHIWVSDCLKICRDNKLI